MCCKSVDDIELRRDALKTEKVNREVIRLSIKFLGDDCYLHPLALKLFLQSNFIFIS